MPKIPRTGLADVPRAVNPSVPVDVGALTAEGVAIHRASREVMDDSERMFQMAMKIQEEKDSLAVVDELNQFRNSAREYVGDLKKRVGKNGLNLQPEARDKIAQLNDEHTLRLGSDRQKNLFKRISAAEVDQSLNQVAAHEYMQLNQYRTDLRNDSINDALLTIRNSAGDQNAITRAIDAHVTQMGVIFAGQDVADYKKADISRLQLEAQTQTQHWRRTTVFNELSTKFEGNPEAAIKQLMAPENYPFLSMEEKNQISTVLTSEFSRMKAFRKEQQEEQAQGLWADYWELRYGSKRNERGGLARWHAKVADLTSRGAIPSNIMLQAIQMEQQEQASIRAASAAQRADEEYRRKNDPFMRDDPNVAAYWYEKLAKDPGSIDITKLSEALGNGLSYHTYKEISNAKRGKAAQVWTTPNGRLVGQQLNQYKKNYIFDTKDEKNNEEFNVAFKRMEKFLMNKPDASAEEINTEMKAIMKPYTRGKLEKVFDAITDYMSGGPVRPQTPPAAAMEEERGE